MTNLEDYLQSGERIRGKHNSRAIAEYYPGGLPNKITCIIGMPNDREPTKL